MDHFSDESSSSPTQLGFSPIGQRTRSQSSRSRSNTPDRPNSTKSRKPGRPPKHHRNLLTSKEQTQLTSFFKNDMAPTANKGDKSPKKDKALYNTQQSRKRKAMTEGSHDHVGAIGHISKVLKTQQEVSLTQLRQQVADNRESLRSVLRWNGHGFPDHNNTQQDYQRKFTETIGHLKIPDHIVVEVNRFYFQWTGFIHKPKRDEDKPGARNSKGADTLATKQMALASAQKENPRGPPAVLVWCTDPLFPEWLLRFKGGGIEQMKDLHKENGAWGKKISFNKQEPEAATAMRNYTMRMVERMRKTLEARNFGTKHQWMSEVERINTTGRSSEHIQLRLRNGKGKDGTLFINYEDLCTDERTIPFRPYTKGGKPMQYPPNVNIKGNRASVRYNIDVAQFGYQDEVENGEGEVDTWEQENPTK